VRCRLAVPVALIAASIASAVPAAAASAPSPIRSTHRTVGLVQGAHARFAASQSNNWSGYNKGALETGSTFHSITGQWVVPTASQAVPGQTEASASWIGIGGGCLETSCLLTDSTLIQAGTEQDIAADGTASYGAWYELIPETETPVSLPVHPGDTVAVNISETAIPEVWSIVIRNVSTGQQFATQTPYPSTYGSAEWIEETPLSVGTDGVGLTAMPKLGTVTFDSATVNGANAQLDPAEQMQLVDANSKPLATPSAPDAERDGFNDCTYASACAAP
jgi:hypothetical protein